MGASLLDKEYRETQPEPISELKAITSALSEISKLLSVDSEMKRTSGALNSSSLNFVKNNIFGITDLKRGTRFNEILESYENGFKENFYVVQSAQQKSKAVIVDLDYFQELLKSKELIEKVYENLCDEHIIQIALERSKDQANIPLSEALMGEENLNFEEIMSMSEMFDQEN